jgi:NitT/TauT family transport system ATP-binding protein
MQWVPYANITEILGLVDILYNNSGSMRIDDLQRYIGVEIDELIPVIDAAKMLGFAMITRDCINITNMGKTLYTMNPEKRKVLISTQICRMPIFRKIVSVLKKEGPKPKAYFLGMIEKELFQKESEQQFRRIIQWGRYAEIIFYDAGRDEMSINAACAFSGQEKEE